VFGKCLAAIKKIGILVAKGPHPNVRRPVFLRRGESERLGEQCLDFQSQARQVFVDLRFFSLG
jgi:hypothetical protein